ncbi:Coenzyme F390 synthetase [hydrothermal vent metagenome]|uniref:Coenzyme F390 synthetase n=1 Tax=hydrothermal vent metagenome TaxID=652676 RepID=A0A3B1DMH4_9ZZZZ
MYNFLYRHILFPLHDRWLRKRNTIAYWKQAEKREWWSRPQLEAYQLEALQNVMSHAYNTCSYYTESWNKTGLIPETIQSLDDIQKFPLISKEAFREHGSQMQSSLPLKLYTKSTGGSSGEPLHFSLDKESNERRTAMMFRGYNWGGGAPGTKQLFIWGSHFSTAKQSTRLKHSLHALYERRKMLSCFDFTPQKMKEHLSTHNQYRPDVIIAYTNPLYEFARFIKNENLTAFSPQSMIVGAEKLHDFQRELIEDVFQAPLFETYGSREFMLIGAECEQHTGLHLSIDNLLVEIVDNDGNPTPDGEEGNVVITDLYNYGMPFIRYINGDRAIAGFEMCECGRGLPLLKKVTGRQLDILETPDGRKIPGEFFPHLMKEFKGIRRFQVLQSLLEKITIKLVIDDSFGETERAMLLTEIIEVAGTEVEIDLQIVEEIPLTKAGKHRVVVREMSTS